MLKAIGEYIAAKHSIQYDKWRENVTFMIDDGSAETFDMAKLSI